MRIHHWLTAIMSVLGPLVVSSTTRAQWQAPPTGPAVTPAAAYQPNPAGPPVPPTAFQPAFTSQYPPGSYPAAPDYLPYPAISPHLGPNIMQDQHFNRNGMWLNQTIHRDRNWYGDVEWVHFYFDGPGASQIGSKTAKLNRDSDEFPTINTWPFGGPLPDFFGVQAGHGVFPFVFVQEGVDEFIGTVILTPPEIFPIRNMSIFDDDVSGDGFKVRTGYFDNDGTGIGFEGWFGLEATDFVQYGQSKINGVPITQDLIAGVDTSGLFPSEIDGSILGGGFIPSSKVGALPLADNSGIIDTLFPGSGFTGSTMKYDILYRVDISTQAGGGNVNFFLGHLYRRPWIQVKSFVAAKYLYVDETFGFRGIDSGFGYEVDIDEDPPTFRPADGVIIGPLYPLFESVLNSETTTHLAGPEIGLRGDLGGGDLFKLWWQGSVGLMVNKERAQVEGFNIGNAHFFNANFGDPTDPADDTGFGTIFGPAFDMFANDTTFREVEHHMHVSPMLQLGLNSELNIFDTLPWTRRLSIFDAAKLTLGYNLLVVGQLARPADSVKWRGFPDFPEVQIERDSWDVHSVSVGLHFER